MTRAMLTPLPQRHVERLGEADHHLPSRNRAIALDEADVALRGSGVERELELADPTTPAPLLKRGGDSLRSASTAIRPVVAHQRRRRDSLQGIAE